MDIGRAVDKRHRDIALDAAQIDGRTHGGVAGDVDAAGGHTCGVGQIKRAGHFGGGDIQCLPGHQRAERHAVRAIAQRVGLRRGGHQTAQRLHVDAGRNPAQIKVFTQDRTRVAGDQQQTRSATRGHAIDLAPVDQRACGGQRHRIEDVDRRLAEIARERLGGFDIGNDLATGCKDMRQIGRIVPRDQRDDRRRRTEIDVVGKVVGLRIGHRHDLRRGQRAQTDRAAAGIGQQPAAGHDQTLQLGKVDVGGNVAQIERPAQHTAAIVGQHHGAGVDALRLRAGQMQARQLCGLDRQFRAADRCAGAAVEGQLERIAQRGQIDVLVVIAHHIQRAAARSADRGRAVQQLVHAHRQALARDKRRQRDRATAAVGQHAAWRGQIGQAGQVDIGRNMRQIERARGVERAVGVVGNLDSTGVGAAVHRRQDGLARQLHRLHRQRGIGRSRPDSDMRAAVGAEMHQHGIGQAGQIDIGRNIVFDIERACARHRQRMAGQVGRSRQHRLRRCQRGQRDRTGGVGKQARAVHSR